MNSSLSIKTQTNVDRYGNHIIVSTLKHDLSANKDKLTNLVKAWTAKNASSMDSSYMQQKEKEKEKTLTYLIFPIS